MRREDLREVKVRYSTRIVALVSNNSLRESVHPAASLSLQFSEAEPVSIV